jgi:hypothetical protein
MKKVKNRFFFTPTEINNVIGDYVDLPITDTDIVIINLTAVSLHPHDTGM